MIEAILQTAAMFAFAAGGYVAGCHRTIARNAAHVECLGCTHRGPDTALRAAQLAAQRHHADTATLPWW